MHLSYYHNLLSRNGNVQTDCSEGNKVAPQMKIIITTVHGHENQDVNSERGWVVT